MKTVRLCLAGTLAVSAEIVDVAVRFNDYRGPYLLHCHNLEHEDMAMMASFVTV